MSIPKITFNRQQGIGRLGVGSDYISGLLAYTDDLPAGFATNNRVKPIFSVKQAEDLGIVSTHSDETKATGGNVLITTPGAAGNVNTITIDGVLLGSYTVVTSDDADDVAAGLRAAINALTDKHGFSAAGSTANVALTAPSKMGAVLNGATVAFASTGTGAATVTQFSSGAGSYLSTLHYHISEFFRMRPDGKLWVGLYAEDTYAGDEIESMQTAANGEIKQFGIFLPHETFTTGHISATQTYLSTIRENYQNAVAILHADCSSLTLANLSSLRSLTGSKVNVNIGEDGNFHQNAYSSSQTYVNGDKVKWLNKTYIAKKSGTGQAPYDNDYFSEISLNLPDILGNSVGTLGNQLGTLALANVEENIGNPERFQLNSGNTLDVPAFATGDLYSSISKSLINQLNDYSYTFIRNFSAPGTYYNDSYTAVAVTDDYATLENNRVMDKAERLIYQAILPKLLSKISVDKDGLLSQITIDTFESAVRTALDTMLSEENFSAYDVSINKDQNVLQTSKLAIKVIIIPFGIAREIEINNSYQVSL